MSHHQQAGRAGASAFAGPPRRKQDFLGKPAPTGYVAGVGRGATGFTTRSDIGPARDLPASAGGGRRGGHHQQQQPRGRNKNNDDDDDDDVDLNESNYDEFAGYGGSLFSKDPYDQDDEEADKIYLEIDRHMSERGKALRENKSRRQAQQQLVQPAVAEGSASEQLAKRPKIQGSFSDLKASLKQLSEDDWLSIPEVGDARNRKQRVGRQDKFTPLPDTLLAHQMKLATGGERLVYLDPRTLDKEPGDGDDDDAAAAAAGHEDDNDADPKRADNGDTLAKRTEAADRGAGAGQAESTTGLNIGELNEFRSSYMSLRLSRVSEAVEGQRAADTKDYLTNLQSMASQQITSGPALREHRRHFAALRASNPTFDNAWIASVRLEEAAGKLSTARQLALEACEHCPRSADLWCEAARLHPPDVARALMVGALRELPRSVALWCRAAELEADEEARRRVFRKAREMVPKSALLWRKSVELEAAAGGGTGAQRDDDGARTEARRAILREAVECCPEEVSFWLELARLEPFDRAEQVLIKASQRHPRERAVWILAAKLKEEAGNKSLVSQIIALAVSQLGAGAGAGASASADPRLAPTPAPAAETQRLEWLREAAEADRDGHPLTCEAVIEQMLGWQVPAAKRRQAWLEDARRLEAAGAVGCARAVFRRMLDFYEGPRVKQESAGQDTRDAHAHADTKAPPTGAAAAGQDAAALKCDEGLWLEWVEFERRNAAGETASSSGQERGGGAWLAGAAVERILRASIRPEACPRSEQLWLALAEHSQRQQHRPAHHLNETRQILAEALDANPDSERIILAAVELECANRNHKEARRILADACMSAKSAHLVMRSARLEWSLGNLDEAARMLSSGAHDYKDHGEFYLALGELEEQRARLEAARGHYSAGLKFCPANVQLWLHAARLEERTNNLARARSKLELARLRNPAEVRLWLEAARFEVRCHEARRRPGKPSMALTLLAKGLRQCRQQADCHLLQTELDLINKQRPTTTTAATTATTTSTTATTTTTTTAAAATKQEWP